MVVPTSSSKRKASNVSFSFNPIFVSIRVVMHVDY